MEQFLLTVVAQIVAEVSVSLFFYFLKRSR